MNKKLMLAGVGVAVVLAGCAASEPDEYDVESYESISNEAAVYCVQQGGELGSFTENNKRVKYCIFSEEDKIEVHEYYEQRHENEENK